MPDVQIPAPIYGISPDIGHPHTDEFNLSFETQLTRTLKFTATGIWRDTGDFVNNVISDATFSPLTITNGLTGQPLTVYRWANASASNDSFFIRNTQGFQYRGTDGGVISTADPTRKYKGLLLALDSSLRNRFGYQLSYVLSKATGTVDNSGFGNWLNGVVWDSPNTATINTDGELTNSRRHEIKAFVSYQVPKIDVMLGGAYFGYSGRPYTPYVQLSRTARLNAADRTPGRRVFLEPRGTERNDFFNQFDLRAEKAFRYERPALRRVRRHLQPVQHRDGDDATGSVSEHDDLRRHGALPGADRRSGRTSGDVRRSLDVLIACGVNTRKARAHAVPGLFFRDGLYFSALRGFRSRPRVERSPQGQLPAPPPGCVPAG